MLFDGDCGFCRYWIEQWQRITRDKVQYRSFQEALIQFPHLTEKECMESVRLILPDGSISSGARAVFKAFAIADRFVWLLKCYDCVPLFGRVAEWGYRLVAAHRIFLSKSHNSVQCRK
jgi:predicted DCC family thiol-disulfide oxidoreductase YuxK